MSIEIKLIACLVAALALAAAFLGYGHYREGEGVRATTATYEAAINKQKAVAATTLASETAKTRSAEQALQTFKNNQELQDADHQKTVASLSTRLRGLAGPAGRLRDPHQAGCGSGSGGAPGAAPTATTDRADDSTEAGGVLSAELSGLLQQRTQEADDINIAYASCRVDAYAVRAGLPE